MVDIIILEIQIGELRSRIKKLAEKKEFTDPEVIGTSQMLDEALLEYEKILRKLKAGR